MKGTNLIPTWRRDARWRRQHVRRCGLMLGAYALLLVAACAAAHAYWPKGRYVSAERLEDAGGRIVALERTIASSRAELQHAQAVLRAGKSVVEQPDWSILMALLAKTTGSQVILKSCEVRPVLSARPPGNPGVPRARGAQSDTLEIVSFAAEVSGVGRTQVEVSQFILRLEQTGLFSRVRLLESGRETFVGETMISFSLECALGDPGVTLR